MRPEISFPLSSKALAVRISLFYIIGSALWIVFSDAILHRVIGNAPGVVWSLETAKGLIYVAVSGILLGLVIHHYQREQERSRLVTESKLRRLRESGLIGIYAYSPDGIVTQANDAFLNMLGYTKEDIRAERVRLHQLTRPADLESSAKIDRALRERGFSPLYEQELMCKDGQRVSVLGGHALMDDDKTFAIAYTLDISQLKAAEAERENLRLQLVQSERLNALGQMAAGVAHDLNNLLTVIIGSGLLLKAAVAPNNPACQHIDNSIRAANQAAGLARKLLAFGRKQTFKPEVFDLNELIEQQCELLKRLLGENIELQFTSSPDCWVKADPAHVEQVLMNLVVNARDAIEERGVITIQTRFQTAKLEGASAEHEYAALTVEDSGKGIEPAIIGQIFEPFFTTKEKQAGTGLGLSTVYGVVKQNDGGISVESVVGVGTRFTVLLPRADPTAAAGHERVA